MITNGRRMPALRAAALLLASLAASGCGTEEPSTPPARSAETAPVPATPPSEVTGSVERTLRGRPFLAERAVLDGNHLVLRDGEAFFAERSVAFFVPEDVLDGTRTLEVSGGSWSPGAPTLFLGVLEPGESLPDIEMVSSGYALRLAFDKRLLYGASFDIELLVEGEAPTRVGGTFFATRGDIRVVRGELDRSHDSVDTLHLIGREHVTRTRPGARVDELSNHGYSTGGTGYGEVTIAEGDGASTLALSYVRGDDGWRVDRELEPGSEEQAAARTPFRRLQEELSEDIGALIVEGLEETVGELLP